MPAVAAVDQLAVRTSLVVAQYEQVVAVAIDVAQRADLGNGGQRVSGVTLRLAPRVEYRPAFDRRVGELEQMLRRLEVGGHLHDDALFDGVHQVVAEQRRAVPVRDVDVVGDRAGQDHDHANAEYRQRVEQRRLPMRLPSAGARRRRAEAHGGWRVACHGSGTIAHIHVGGAHPDGIRQ